MPPKAADGRALNAAKAREAKRKKKEEEQRAAELAAAMSGAVAAGAGAIVPAGHGGALAVRPLATAARKELASLQVSSVVMQAVQHDAFH